jgi:tetratricopeptide (TPR) repeat protein
MAQVRDELERAVYLRENGRAEEARELLLKLVAEKPGDPQINHHCAWVHDLLGREHEAVPFYERAIEEGLTGEDLEGAMLGLGSTYRALGEYERAVETLRGGTTRFPNSRAMQVFLAMVLYNTGEGREAVELLLRNLAETTGDGGISAYNRAILFYAGRLDETWG